MPGGLRLVLGVSAAAGRGTGNLLDCCHSHRFVLFSVLYYHLQLLKLMAYHITTHTYTSVGYLQLILCHQTAELGASQNFAGEL